MQSNFDNLGYHRLVYAVVNVHYHQYSYSIGILSLLIAFKNYYKVSLVWGPGQNKRIAPLSFLHGCRKRRLKD
jgi:hypothetical protein